MPGLTILGHTIPYEVVIPAAAGVLAGGYVLIRNQGSGAAKQVAPADLGATQPALTTPTPPAPPDYTALLQQLLAQLARLNAGTPGVPGAPAGGSSVPGSSPGGSQVPQPLASSVGNGVLPGGNPPPAPGNVLTAPGTTAPGYAPGIIGWDVGNNAPIYSGGNQVSGGYPSGSGGGATGPGSGGPGDTGYGVPGSGGD